MATIEYIWSQDPAIDKNNSTYNLEAYRKTLDRKHLPIVEPPEPPAVFRLRRLPRRIMQHIDALIHEDKKMQALTEAFAYGVERIEGWSVDGQPLECGKTKTALGERLDDATIDVVYDAALFMEVGGQVYTISCLDPTSGRASR